MALTDYDVQIIDVAPAPNTKQNPLSGDSIDPTGATLSEFSMTITDNSVVPPFVLKRTDLLSTPDAASLKRYALSVIDVLERNKAAQRKNGTPSPLSGKLDILPPVVAPPSADDLSVQAFVVLVQAWITLKQKILIDKSIQQTDIDTAAAAIKDAYAPKGTPVSADLAARFDATYVQMTKGLA